MKTNFNNKLAAILAANGSRIEDVATLPARKLTAFRKEAAKQCLQDILSIRAIRIEQDKALKAKAALFNVSEPVAQAKSAATPSQKNSGVEKSFLVGKTFQIPVPATLKVMVSNHNPDHPLTPTANPLYAFRGKEVMNFILFLVMQERFAYFFGPTGSGKSSQVTEMAARLGVPVVDCTGHDRMESPELFGGWKLNSTGGMDWVDGPLIRAIKEDAWFLLNEIDQIPPSTLVGLNGVTESTVTQIQVPETGEIVKIGKGFRFIATGNSNGAGDATGLYQGVRRMSLAFMDRAVKQEITYPKPEVEQGLLERCYPSLGSEIVTKMVEFTNEVRRLFVEGGMEVTLSTRSLLRWAKIAHSIVDLYKGAKGIDPLRTGLDQTVGLLAEPTTRETLQELMQRHFGNGGAI